MAEPFILFRSMRQKINNKQTDRKESNKAKSPERHKKDRRRAETSEDRHQRGRMKKYISETKLVLLRHHQRTRQQLQLEHR